MEGGGAELSSLEGTVDMDSRLLKRAVRIPDWSHIIANLMEAAAKAVHERPSILATVRSLCSFWNNGTYRLQVARALARLGVPDARKRLKRFGVRLAKRRCETLHDCFETLLKLRDLHENHIATSLLDILPSCQDPARVKEVVQASSWRSLWIFINVFFEYVLSPL